MNTKQLISTLGFAISLTTIAAPSGAQESGVEGRSAGSDLINTSTWDQLASETVTIPNTGSVWHCAATCSAEVERTNGNSLGGFVILRNGAAQASTRSFSLSVLVMEVGTTVSMENLGSGNHTMACAARKNSASQPNFRVNDSSISVVCSDNRL